ncbi:MAG: hypothetical protein WCR07_13530 [Verrucomicrobiota bacterium]
MKPPVTIPCSPPVPCPRPAAAARAVTLVELVVVLVIVCVVTGLVAWVGTRLLRRSVAVASAGVAAEVAAAVARHQARTGGLPDGYDSLLEAPYTLFAFIPAASRRQLKPKDLDNADRGVLRAHGITTTWMHPGPDGSGVSWQELTDRKALDVTAGGFAADDVVALDLRRVNPNELFGGGVVKGTIHETFMVLGIGPRCTLVGPSGELAEAPVLAASSRAMDPADFYRRLALVVRLDRDDPRPVQCLGIVVFDETGIQTAQGLLAVLGR